MILENDPDPAETDEDAPEANLESNLPLCEWCQDSLKIYDMSVKRRVPCPNCV